MPKKPCLLQKHLLIECAAWKLLNLSGLGFQSSFASHLVQVPTGVPHPLPRALLCGDCQRLPPHQPPKHPIFKQL